MSATRDWLPDEVVSHLGHILSEPLESSGGASRYELLDVLGQGGMGTVYRALDRDLGREVALKVVAAPDERPIRGQEGGSPWATAVPEAADRRLLAEARILASLEHPGLVPVHDAGTLADGRVFYAMKWVRGVRLDAYAIERRDAGEAELLRVFERICETVAFAHAHGVIHRDLKPENVMVGPFGEVLVLDWGTGEILGTPGYMAPEIHRGEPASVASDVFSLGAVLTFLLTGAPPVDTPTSRRPLAAICAKATAADPARRYAGAAALVADLASYRAGLAVQALPDSWPRHAGRVVRRHSTAILLVLAYVLMRLLLLLFFIRR